MEYKAKREQPVLNLHDKSSYLAHATGVRGSSRTTLARKGGFQKLYKKVKNDERRGWVLNIQPSSAKPETVLTTSVDRASRKSQSLLQHTSAMLAAPYLLANTVLTVGASFAVLGILLSGGVSGHWENLQSGAPMALSLTLGAFIALLCGTMGLAMLADRKATAQRETQSLEEKREAKELNQSLKASLRDVTQMQEELSDTIHLVAARSNATWYHRPNNFKSWNTLAPESELISIDGVCVGEISNTKNAHGEHCLRANLEFLEHAWLPRFTNHTKLARVSHLIGVQLSEDGQIQINPKIQRLLGAYRCVRDIADSKGRTVDYSGVEIILFDAALWTNTSVFLGTKRSRASERETHPFVQRYTSIPVPAANLLNTEVEVSYSTDLVAHYRSISNDLVGSALRILNLEEAEAQFGADVPKFMNGSNKPIVLKRPQERSFEVIDHGDGSFSMGDYLC